MKYSEPTVYDTNIRFLLIAVILWGGWELQWQKKIVTSV